MPNKHFAAFAPSAPMHTPLPQAQKNSRFYWGVSGLLAGYCLMALGVAWGDEPAAKSPPDEQMVWIAGGTFWMGSENGPQDERPRHAVRVDGFWMDKTEVTNTQFAEFVKATGYVTVAERKPDPKYFPGLDPKLLDRPPFSVVFFPSNRPVNLQMPPTWWHLVPGADWRHPEGPGSSIKDRMDHPVVHVCYDDALAYCKWAGKRLPSEAEWEYAARGGLDRKEFVWGDGAPSKDGKWQANIWQGPFPVHNRKQDGYKRTAPVASFPANGYGLYDMSGNVWEWCHDYYQPNYYAKSPKDNPQGPATGRVRDPHTLPEPVRRGGSYLCCDQYCRRYLPSARDASPPDSGACHTGFRCVKSAE